MYSKSVRPIFWWKNGRADDRKSRLFGALRIVLGLHLSICGVVDLPIIGSNLVKTGVQDAIFDRFWWSFIWNAKVGRFVHVAPKYVFLSATPQLLCDIAKITNFLLFCKKIPYYMELEGIKNKKFRYYFHKYGQIRISTHFLALSLHRQNWETRPSLSLTDTHGLPTHPLLFSGKCRDFVGENDW